MYEVSVILHENIRNFNFTFILASTNVFDLRSKKINFDFSIAGEEDGTERIHKAAPIIAASH